MAATIVFTQITHFFFFFKTGRDFTMAKMNFTFTIGSKSSIDSFNIIKDGVCELDEIFAAEILPEAIQGFEVRAQEPITTFIIIKDVDGECQ